MTTVPISEAREHLADLGNRVALRGERVVVKRRGKTFSPWSRSRTWNCWSDMRTSWICG